MGALLWWNAGGWKWKVEGRALPMVFSPCTCPLPLVFGFRTTGFVGIGSGLRDYDRRRRIIANAPKPKARSERAEGSGITVESTLLLKPATIRLFPE